MTDPRAGDEDTVAGPNVPAVRVIDPSAETRASGARTIVSVDGGPDADMDGVPSRIGTWTTRSPTSRRCACTCTRSCTPTPCAATRGSARCTPTRAGARSSASDGPALVLCHARG